jgi:hypothetical protein
MPESLENQFISDLYTSLLHLSGAELGPNGPLNKVFDGAGNSTGLALSGKRVIINNYIYPEGYSDKQTEWLDAFFPVGCLQLTFDNNDPGTRIAGTEWRQVAQGRFLVGVGSFKDKNNFTRTFCPGSPEDLDIKNDGNLAGEYRHELTVGEIPSHAHGFNDGIGQKIQIPTPIGGGPFFTGPDSIGLVDSTNTFTEQQRKRNALAAKIGWNLNDPYGYIGDTAPNWENATNAAGYLEYLYPVKYAFDLNFMRGSAGKYSAGFNRDPRGKANFTDNANWQFKEMVGIWNGETRFIPERSAGRDNIPAGSIQDHLRNIDWHKECLDLGCVDVGDAEAADFVTQNNETPFGTGNIDSSSAQTGTDNVYDTDFTGGGIPHNNIPPSYGVYVWRRIT